MVVAWGSAGAHSPARRSRATAASWCRSSDGALAAVIDGLGHGPEACGPLALPSACCLRLPGEPIDELVRRCHEALRRRAAR